MAPHKFDKIEFNKKKQAKTALEKPKGNIKSVTALRDRLYIIEEFLGIKARI